MLSQGQQMILNLVYDESTKNEEISFSVFHSDYSRNQIAQELLVSTLVKYGNSGRFETYLAKQWEVSSNKKLWKFYLQEGVETENGVEITAVNFKKSLLKLLRKYAKNSTISVFSDVVGWSDFEKKLDDIKGIKTEEKYVISMEFNNPPSGLLEYLSMPYFGFYDEENFNGDEWRDERKIISSSKYKVKEYKNGVVILELRKNFKLATGREPEIIKLYAGEKKIINSNEAYIFENRVKSREIEGVELVHGTPTVLNAIVLSPYLEPFKNSELRSRFLKRIQQEMGTEDVPFYFKNGNTVLRYEEQVGKNLDFQKKHLKIFMQNLNDIDEEERYKILWEKLAKKYNFTYSLDTPLSLGKDWVRLALTNKSYHLRVARVDIGGAPENWSLGMMFCTGLGISFPDPENKICGVYEKYKILGIDDQNGYEKEIFSEINASKTVVPIRHSGFSWYFSKNINLNEHSQTMTMPKLDTIQLNE